MKNETLQTLYLELCSVPVRLQEQVINKFLNLDQDIVPDLLNYVEQADDENIKKSLLFILLKFEDQRSEALFIKLLNSDDEDIRSLACQGLVLLKSPYALQACITTINDSADFAHGDVTPAVLSLAEMGVSALLVLVELLNDKSRDTRQHTQKVFELVSYKKMQNRYKPHALSETAREKWNELWVENGSYHWDMPESERVISMNRWKKWIDAHKGAC